MAIKSKPQNIDDYLIGLSVEKRACLENLRKLIKSEVPQAEECISYGIPAFRLAGRILVGFGSAANHCAFYPMSGRTVAALQEELAGFDTSKATIRFREDRPLPETLVRKLINARVAENLNKVK